MHDERGNKLVVGVVEVGEALLEGVLGPLPHLPQQQQQNKDDIHTCFSSEKEQCNAKQVAMFISHLTQQ